MGSTTQAQDAYLEMATRLKDVILAEVYARVQKIPMLAHYTSVNAFGSMLRSKEFWFSSIPDMAAVDTSEVVEGTEVVYDALRRFGPQIIKQIPYSRLNATIVLEAIKPRLISETYAISMCEHGGDAQSDRLVMWRAYGHNGHGLCLVLRKETMLGQTAAGRFPVHWSPIEYDTTEQLEERVKRRLAQIEDAVTTIAAPFRPFIAPVLGELIASAMLSLIIGHKNPAYRDEQEIRFVRTSLIQLAPVPADAVYREVGTKEKPRTVFALPLRKYPEFGIDADIRSLLDHIIIGPSHEQEKMHAETRELLDANGLAHVEIRRSDIPFRATKIG